MVHATLGIPAPPRDGPPIAVLQSSHFELGRSSGSFGPPLVGSFGRCWAHWIPAAWRRDRRCAVERAIFDPRLLTLRSPIAVLQPLNFGFGRSSASFGPPLVGSFGRRRALGFLPHGAEIVGCAFGRAILDRRLLAIVSVPPDVEGDGRIAPAAAIPYH
jgi:hypothetical protein